MVSLPSSAPQDLVEQRSGCSDEKERKRGVLSSSFPFLSLFYLCFLVRFKLPLTGDQFHRPEHRAPYPHVTSLPNDPLVIHRAFHGFVSTSSVFPVPFLCWLFWIGCFIKKNPQSDWSAERCWNIIRMKRKEERLRLLYIVYPVTFRHRRYTQTYTTVVFELRWVGRRPSPINRCYATKGSQVLVLCALHERLPK